MVWGKSISMFTRSAVSVCGRRGSSRKVNKGHGIANIHYLSDGLYKYKPSTD